MVDSAVILDNIKVSLNNLYHHLKKYKIDICLNNVIFKWLVTLFFENTLFFEEKNIMKCTNLGDASIFFDQNLRLFKHKKFSYYLLNKDFFNLNIDDINKLRAKKFPKIKENIKKINEFENNKKRKESDTTCDIDWPYCIKLLGSTKIIDVMKYKVYEKPLIENDYFDISHNVYKLAEDGKEEQINSLKNLENEKNEQKKKTIIYGNLLIERPYHNCDRKFSSRKDILGENSGKKSSLMGSFFESFKKKDEDQKKTLSNSEEELINMMSYKNEIDHNIFIENIMENNNENNEQDEIKELRKGSWFKNIQA